ncbi:jg9702 [Pararge aegeria aegeria]|uniref:Jg9702 protein n=1 Tax=Pararge aegeria aegeria TaxID=348720 RepID=A0A8S4SK75_9NEOP|nr:jg9702 [Pararge aegeria aegeria]
MLTKDKKILLKIYKKKKTPSASGAFECPSHRQSELQSEEPPHNTRRFKDYCLLYPTLDPTTKRKFLKMFVKDQTDEQQPTQQLNAVYQLVQAAFGPFIRSVFQVLRDVPLPFNLRKDFPS